MKSDCDAGESWSNADAMCPVKMIIAVMLTVLSAMTSPYSGKPQYAASDSLVIDEERRGEEGE